MNSIESIVFKVSKYTMSSPIKLTIEPFEYILTLQDSVLHIVAKHLDECLIWSTIIDDILDDPETMKVNGNTKKQFIANLEPEEIFEIFDQYKKGELGPNIKITFPQMFKTEKEHLCIVIEFQRSFGKRQNDTKWIMLNPENISKDVIIFQKLELLKNKTSLKINEIEKNISYLNAQTQEITTKFNSDLEKLKISMKDEMKSELESMKSVITQECDKKYQSKV